MTSDFSQPTNHPAPAYSNASPADGSDRRRGDDADGPASLRAVLSSIGETLYDWDLASDRITWGANAAAMLRVADVAVLGTGRAYAFRVVRDSGLPASTW